GVEFTITPESLAFEGKGTIMILRHTDARAVARASQRAAFTLMEVLVVAAIIVILAGSGAVLYTNYLDTAKEKTAYMTITELSKAAETYKVDNGDYPP